jgi:hypothetical protein
VDIDLDCTEALALADIYLPTTGAEFGRLSKPRSHRLYIAAGATFETFADPLRNNKNTLIEIRAAGRDGGAHQTLFPPSIADNERRKWQAEDVIAPALVEAPALRCRVAWLATGCLVMRYVSKYAAQRPAADFPKLLWEFDQALGRRAYGFLGIAAPDSRIHNLRPRNQLSQDDVDLAEIVHAIPNDCDWESWNAIGMAVFVASGGSDHGRVIFDDFSAKSAKYDPEAVNERWRNYRHSRPTRTGLSKLISLALKAGWRPAGRPVE